MPPFDMTSRKEGFEIKRVLVARGDLSRFVAPDGWEVVSYGPPLEMPGNQIAITLRHPLPPAPRKETIIDLALTLLNPHGKCTISWMSGKFGLADYQLISLLEAAGLPPKGSERPWLRNGDWILWFDRDTIRCKRVEPKEEQMEEQDFYSYYTKTENP